MEPFISHAGIPVPLRRGNVDTDQIIPAVYLKRITRTGFEDGLFSAWRDDPSFILNQEPYDKGTILVAGPDFGTGSSREHAVWALQNYGFQVVIGSRFGDIFRGNSGKAGLVIATVPQEVVEELWAYIEAHPGEPIEVSLEDREISTKERTYPFQIDDYTRHRLLNGLDDIAVTLQNEADITRYESSRLAIKPASLPVRTAD